MHQTGNKPGKSKKTYETPTCTQLSQTELVKLILHAEDSETRAAEAALAALKGLLRIRQGVFGLGAGAANE